MSGEKMGDREGVDMENSINGARGRKQEYMNINDQFYFSWMIKFKWFHGSDPRRILA